MRDSCSLNPGKEQTAFTPCITGNEFPGRMATWQPVLQHIWPKLTKWEVSLILIYNKQPIPAVESCLSVLISAHTLTGYSAKNENRKTIIITDFPYSYSGICGKNITYMDREKYR
jgi:hypothetical protein